VKYPLRKIPVVFQVMGVLIALGVLFAVAIYTAVSSSREATSVASARSAATYAESLKAYFAKSGGVYTKAEYGDDLKSFGRYFSQVPASFVTADGVVKQYTFLHKCPETVINEVGATLSQARGIKSVRVVSDTPMNPANAVDPAGQSALAQLRRGASEVWGPRGGSMVYHRAIVAEKACMACHGPDAPKDIASVFPAARSVEFAAGQVVGALRVEVKDTQGGLDASSLVVITVCAVVFVSVMVFFVFMVAVFVRQLQGVTAAQTRLANGDASGAEVASEHVAIGQEMLLQFRAHNALRESVVALLSAIGVNGGR
jgi:mono/diheme cytochrome c family protein